MQIDVNLRARAARTLLDAVSAMTAEQSGTEEADQMALLALAQLDLPPIEENPQLAAALAAATDLLWGVTLYLSQWRGESREATIATIRQELLPRVYPDAD